MLAFLMFSYNSILMFLDNFIFRLKSSRNQKMERRKQHGNGSTVPFQMRRKKASKIQVSMG